MGFRQWLKRLFTRTEPSDTVAFFDVDAGAVVRIPRRELCPGAIEVQIQGMDGLVWVLPDRLEPGPIQHPTFDDDIRAYIRQIQTAFAEHRNLTLDEWEDGFRRDAHPEREIALWSHAADIYERFTSDENSHDRRVDVYRCIIACMTASPDSVWNVLEPKTLDHAEAKRIVDSFYGKVA